MKYEEYIRTELWKNKRRERLIIDDNECQLCCSKEGLQIHHKHYNSLGNEDVKKDLLTLCQRCHDIATDKIREARYKNKETMLVENNYKTVNTNRKIISNKIPIFEHKEKYVRGY